MWLKIQKNGSFQTATRLGCFRHTCRQAGKSIMPLEIHQQTFWLTQQWVYPKNVYSRYGDEGGQIVRWVSQQRAWLIGFII